MVQCFLKQKKTARFQSKPELLYVSVARGCEVQEHPRSLHCHENHAEVLLIREGKGNFTVGGHVHPVKKGDLLFINQGVVHDEMNSCLSMYACAVNCLEKPGLSVNHWLPEEADPVIACGVRFEETEQILGRILCLLSCGGEEADERVRSLFQELLELLDDIAGQGMKKRKAASFDSRSEKNRRIMAAQIRAYIDANYQNDMSLKRISDDLHISAFYLAHVFKEQTGYSPMQYILQRRIGKAQNLLLETDMTVTRIATEVGYNNPNLFNTMFSKNVGLSPRKYRRINLAKESEGLTNLVG